MPAKRRLDSLLSILAAICLLGAALWRPAGEHAVQGTRAGAGSPGRDAAAPSEIPARGWWAIAKRVMAQVSAHNVMAQAAGVTFFALLALFPALAALVSLYGLFADPATIAGQMNAMAGVVPGGGMDILNDQVHRLASNGRGALGFGLLIGLATSLWSANQGTKALFDALNVVYDERETRSYLRRTLLSLCFTLGALLFVLVAMALVVALPIALNFIGIGHGLDLLLRLARWPVMLVVVTALLSILYRFGPSREHARWRWVSWGGAFATIAWLLVSAGFSWYVSSFGSYNKTYGSLGAVVGFMTWIWLSATVVLTGAELNAEMEHQTAQDTTTGPQRPMGARVATKADEVAAA